MCEVLEVSKSGYYKWLSSEPSARVSENRALTEQIRSIHRMSRQSYGSPRIAKELQSLGLRTSKPRVERLMRDAGIRSRLKRKYVATTDSKHGFKVAENLLQRNFKVEAVSKVWVSDITYIRTGQGWLYLTIIMDLGDRKVIGWSLSRTLKAEDTVIAAFLMAAINRPFRADIIFHSDRGVQYACTEFTNLLSRYKMMRQSMSRKGDCWDNAVAESFFKSLKSEWTSWQKYRTFPEAELSVFEYIEGWYNVKRRHSTLNYMTPIEYEDFLLTRKLAA